MSFYRPPSFYTTESRSVYATVWHKTQCNGEYPAWNQFNLGKKVEHDFRVIQRNLTV